jgi:hypothetical protein
MAASSEIRLHVENFGTTQPLFSESFAVAKTLYTLTRREEKVRRQWNKERGAFRTTREVELYGQSCVKSQADLVASSILPPSFAANIVSQRSKVAETRHKRNYPPNIEEWSDFGPSVQDEAFDEDPPVNTERFLDPLLSSSDYTKKVQSEKCEEEFLSNFLWNKLELMDLMVMEDEALARSPNGSRNVKHGLPDNANFRVIENQAARTDAVIECKSSHNLLIPNDVALLKRKYETALANQTATRETARSRDWCHINHPFGQLFGYMIDNKTRFGALCSASKTYFVYLDEQMQLRVTEAWFTGHRSFFRAWACFIRLAGRDELAALTGLPNNWLPSTPLAITSNADNGYAAGNDPGNDHGDVDDDDDGPGNVDTTQGTGGAKKEKTKPKQPEYAGKEDSCD